MNTLIQGECERLGLAEPWRRTITTLLSHFESAENVDQLVTAKSELSVDSDQMELSSVGILDALRHIEQTDPIAVKRVLFCRAIARLPIFYERVRRDGPQGPEFWNPLEEDLPAFLERGAPGSVIRRYRAAGALPAEDVVQAQLYDYLVPE